MKRTLRKDALDAAAKKRMFIFILNCMLLQSKLRVNKIVSLFHKTEKYAGKSLYILAKGKNVFRFIF